MLRQACVSALNDSDVVSGGRSQTSFPKLAAYSDIICVVL